MRRSRARCSSTARSRAAPSAVASASPPPASPGWPSPSSSAGSSSSSTRSPTGAVGRPVRPLDVAPDLGSFAGIKLTGDAVYAVLTDARAQIRRRARGRARPTPHPAAVVALLGEHRLRVLGRSRPPPLVGIGVSLGGAVDDDGRVIRAPFLGWTDVDLGAGARRGHRPSRHGRERRRRARRGRALVRRGPRPPGLLGHHDRRRASATGSSSAASRCTPARPGVGLGGHIPLDPTGPLCSEGPPGLLERAHHVGRHVRAGAGGARAAGRLRRGARASRRRGTPPRRRWWMPRHAASAA